MPGNSADVKIETHCCMTDITQTLYIYYKNSLISTIWSRVWEHSEHFKRLWKNTSEDPARKWILRKCWNGPTLALDLKKPITSQALPMSLSLVFPSQGLVRVTQAFQDKGKHPKLFKLWKNSCWIFSCIPSCSCRSFYQYLSFQAMGRRNWKQNPACLLGSCLHRPSHKHPSIPMHTGNLSGINVMTHIRSGRYMHW